MLDLTNLAFYLKKNTKICNRI